VKNPHGIVNDCDYSPQIEEKVKTTLQIVKHLSHSSLSLFYLFVSVMLLSESFYGTLTYFSVAVLLFYKIYKLTFIFMK